MHIVQVSNQLINSQKSFDRVIILLFQLKMKLENVEIVEWLGIPLCPAFMGLTPDKLILAYVGSHISCICKSVLVAQFSWLAQKQEGNTKK